MRTPLSKSVVPDPVAAPVESWNGVRAAIAVYARARTRRKDVAEDIAQEAVLRAIDYCRSHDVASVYALAFRIASNLVNDLYRHERRHLAEVAESPCEAPAPDRVMIGQQEIALLAEALAGMPPLRREVFVRRRLRGQSCAGIAQDLELSPKAVEKHITRALAELGALLGRRDAT